MNIKIIKSNLFFLKKKTAGLIAYRDDGKLNDEGINILSSILNKFNKIMNLLNVARKIFLCNSQFEKYFKYL